MEKKQYAMETALSESLRDLMVRRMFDKITIKQICDQTGVIRATFYNHFEDKYDCLNWIVRNDLIGMYGDNLLKSDYAAALEQAFRRIEENRDFYRAAYQVTGQNSFEDMIRSNLKEVIMNYLERYRKKNFMEKYDNELLAGYYAEAMAYCIRTFVFAQNGQKSVEEMMDMIIDLTHHSVKDFLNYT